MIRRTTHEEFIALLLLWSPKTRERELAAFTERAGRGAATVSYMACGEQGCLAPVIDRRVTFAVQD